ncbi:MAG: purine permease [Proteobacteria bacterium]|nr:purine permease [Pseudomonadota bacterium]
MREHNDPNYTPPLARAIPLGLQHVLAMFASNVTPSIIIAGVAGLAGGDKVYLIQMAMLFSGVATLMQTIGMGRVGARLPIMQGTSFAFVPIMIPVAKSAGMAAVLGGALIGGIFHFILGTFIGKLRRFLPPLVTGIVVLTIGLALIPIGIKYAAGGVWLMNNKPEFFGGLNHWGLALLVVFVTLGIKFFLRGFLTSAAALIGLVVGYLAAIPLGMINFASVGDATWFAVPRPLYFGFEINAAAVIGMCLMSIVSAIETVGDISAITKGGAGREATDKEMSGGTMADGAGTTLAAIFGGLPNTSFSQNVGLIAMTGVISRHVVTIGGIFLIACGLIPKIGAVIAAMPQAVLGGGVIIMFGMVVSAGLRMLAEVKMNRRNMIIIAVSLSFGLGMQAVPEALAHLNSTLKLLLVSGLLPAATLAVVLNLFLPEEDAATTA